MAKILLATVCGILAAVAYIVAGYLWWKGRKEQKATVFEAKAINKGPCPNQKQTPLYFDVEWPAGTIRRVKAEPFIPTDIQIRPKDKVKICLTSKNGSDDLYAVVKDKRYAKKREKKAELLMLILGILETIGMVLIIVLVR